MSDYVALAERQLRSVGYRLTAARQKVIEVLAHSDRALSPYAIIDQLRAAHDMSVPDVVTVYRILDLLATLGLVHRVHTVNGYVACTLHDDQACHHHLICARCGRIAEVQGHLEGQGLPSAPTGWSIASHVLEFSGLCPECLQGA